MTLTPAQREQARFNMIEQQIRPWGVADVQVLHLLSVIPREDFVPAAHKALAFIDMEIPLNANHAEALRLGQIMLAPKVEARMLQELAPHKHETVLEIGAGSGYMAALLAHRSQRVVTMEIVPELAEMARANLLRNGVYNAEVRLIDASKAPGKEAAFDVILLSGTVAEVPQSLLDQLKLGGRLGAIVGTDPVMRATVITRTGERQFQTRQPWDTHAPALLNFPRPAAFVF